MEPEKVVDKNAPSRHSELVKEEFYKWFESRGLLSELRSYMRQLMVKALEESNKSSVTVQRKAATSPKLQAINLLIIDFLFHEDYLYTVSVFASEAHFLSSLPQYSRYVMETVGQRRWDPQNLPRFSRQETEDILDTLRLPPSRADVQRATQLYVSGRDSLLECVARTVAASAMAMQNGNMADKDVVVAGQCGCGHEGGPVVDNYQLWSAEMQSLLLLAGVKMPHIRRMQDKWAQVIEEEKKKVLRQAKQEQVSERVQRDQEVGLRLREERKDLEDERKRLEVEAVRLAEKQQALAERQKRVEVRERGLASLAEELTAIREDVSQRLSDLKEQNEIVITEDPETKGEKNNHGCDCPTSQQIVHDKTVAVGNVAIQVDVAVVKESEAASTQTECVTESASTQTVDTADTEQQTSTAETDPELVQQLYTDREKITELQEENLELRAHALQQRQRINELTNRAASLSRQLEEAQVAISVLSGRESAVVPAPAPGPTWGASAAPAPAPPLAFIAPTFGFNSPQRQGAGEESLFAPRPQQTPQRPDMRRRPLRFAFSQNPSPNSEESSPTDEVIQNARSRIQQLEAESAAVQRSYQEMRNRLVTSDSVMFPPLGNPLRVADPILRVRVNDVPAFSRVHHSSYAHAMLFRPRARQAQLPDEEESSSDQSLLYESRLENMRQSRRLFTPRNIRHFERWKQFKKKFQKRNNVEYRRNSNNPKLNSDTSSDDDEEIARNATRECERSRARNMPDNSNIPQPTQQVCDTNIKRTTNNVRVASQTKSVGCSSDQNFVSQLGSKKTLHSTNPVPENIQEPSCSRTMPATTVKDKASQEKLRVEVERSAKLIESVRILLEAQNIENIPVKQSISNGSLILESLPRDTEIDSAEDWQIPVDSAITGRKSKTAVEESRQHTDVSEGDYQPSTDRHSNTDPSVIARQKFGSEGTRSQELKHDTDFEKDSNCLLPLTCPNLTLVTEANAHTTQATDRGEAEGQVESVTSGSDILRELVPSSDSVVSTGWADDSKHSEDFWN